MRHVLYVAHPLGAPDARGIQANILRALRWLAWLRKTYPNITFIAPWIAAVLAGADDSDPAAREAGLVDDCAVVERCDGIVLCGGRISSGMRREMEHRWGSREEGGPFESEVYDLTAVGAEPHYVTTEPNLIRLHFLCWDPPP